MTSYLYITPFRLNKSRMLFFTKPKANMDQQHKNKLKRVTKYARNVTIAVHLKIIWSYNSNNMRIISHKSCHERWNKSNSFKFPMSSESKKWKTITRKVQTYSPIFIIVHMKLTIDAECVIWLRNGADVEQLITQKIYHF